MNDLFHTDAGMSVPSVTVGQMTEVDRIAIDHHTPNLHQIMENSGHRGTWRVDPIDGGVVTVRFDAEVRRIPGASTLAAKLSERAESELEPVSRVTASLWRVSKAQTERSAWRS